MELDGTGGSKRAGGVRGVVVTVQYSSEGLNLNPSSNLRLPLNLGLGVWF